MTTNIGVATDSNSRVGECESSRSCNGMEMRRRWWKRRCLRRICCFFGLLLLINICLTSFAISKLKHIEVQLDSTPMDGPMDGPDFKVNNGPNNYGGMNNGPNGPNGSNGPNGPNTDIYYDNPAQPNVDPSSSNINFNGQNKHHFDRKKICSDLCTEICTATACDVFVCSETCVSVFTKRHEMRMKYGQTDENVQPLPVTDVSPSYPINVDQMEGSSNQPISSQNNVIEDINIVNTNNNNNNNNDNTRPKPYHHRNKKSDSEPQEGSDNMDPNQFIKSNVNRKRMSPHQKPEKPERPERQERSERFGRFNF